MKILASTLVCAALATQAFAEVPARLGEWAVHKNLAIGSFVLEKEIPDIGVSARSAGTFRFEKSKGLFWQNISPEKFAFFANESYFEITTPEGSKKSSLENFGIKDAASLLFKGDFSDFEKKFKIEVLEEGKDKISIKLMPKISKIKNGLDFAVITFAGNSAESCVLHLANETLIKITFKETL